MKSKPRYCWDSNIFMGWLKEDKKRSEKEKKICASSDFIAVLNEIDKKDSILIVPVIIYTEVLEYHHDASQMKVMHGFLRRSNIHPVNITITLAESASEIRSAWLAETPKRKIETPDALILAAAIEADANMLHTTDPDLLGVNGHATAKGVCICEPRTLSGTRTLPHT